MVFLSAKIYDTGINQNGPRYILFQFLPQIKIWRHFNQALDILFHPNQVVAYLAETKDMGPAWIALAVTSILFAFNSLASHFHHIPYSAAPLWPHPWYRIFQALAMPLVLGLGCLINTAIIYLLNFILRVKAPFSRIFSIIAPVLLVPHWFMMWPTEAAISLGVLDPNTPGFVGLWVKQLMPALSLFYILFLLWFALWSFLRILLREAFALAVLSLFAVLGFWSLVMR
jgi:hypothetical protein